MEGQLNGESLALFMFSAVFCNTKYSEGKKRVLIPLCTEKDYLGAQLIKGASNAIVCPIVDNYDMMVTTHKEGMFPLYINKGGCDVEGVYDVCIESDSNEYKYNIRKNGYIIHLCKEEKIIDGFKTLLTVDAGYSMLALLRRNYG